MHYYSNSPFIVLFILFGFFTYSSFSWQIENGINIDTGLPYYDNPAMIKDSNGDIIFAWSSFYTPETADYGYAQKISFTGAKKWYNDGIPFCRAETNLINIDDENQLVSDGAGGAIYLIKSNEGSNGQDIYAQRISQSGSSVWSSRASICTLSGDQYNPRAVTDAIGGIIVVWTDARDTTKGLDIYAQRVDINGNLLWASNGITLCSVTGDQYNPRITDDGQGGAYVIWTDQRDTTTNYLYGQHLYSNGSIAWGNNGIPLFYNVPQSNFGPEIISDYNGNAIMATYRANGLALQKVNNVGALLWSSTGLYLPTVNVPNHYQLSSDSSGNSIITWAEARYSTWNIYASKVLTSGTTVWTSGGISLSTTTNDKNFPRIVSDDNGGAVIAWEEYTLSVRDIYAQHINNSGTLLWTSNGFAVCTAENLQRSINLISDGTGGAVISWIDARSNGPGIYAQKINGTGNLLAVPSDYWQSLDEE